MVTQFAILYKFISDFVSITSHYHGNETRNVTVMVLLVLLVLGTIMCGGPCCRMTRLRVSVSLVSASPLLGTMAPCVLWPLRRGQRLNLPDVCIRIDHRSLLLRHTLSRARSLSLSPAARRPPPPVPSYRTSPLPPHSSRLQQRYR